MGKITWLTTWGTRAGPAMQKGPSAAARIDRTTVKVASSASSTSRPKSMSHSWQRPCSPSCASVGTPSTATRQLGQITSQRSSKSPAFTPSSAAASTARRGAPHASASA